MKVKVKLVGNAWLKDMANKEYELEVVSGYVDDALWDLRNGYEVELVENPTVKTDPPIFSYTTTAAEISKISLQDFFGQEIKSLNVEFK